MKSVLKTSYAAEDLAMLAADLLAYAGANRIFLLYGDMGAGKTTFIKAICKALGVTETVSSPTFSIVNEYRGSDSTVFHFDFYRLKNEEEAYDLGYEEYFYSGDYCFIEWPEKVANLIPPAHVTVQIQVVSETQRTFIFDKRP